MVKRFKLLVLACVVLGLMIPAAANATITQIFGSITCTTQTTGAQIGQRWCGTSANTTTTSFDGTPIDVAMAFPVESGSDNNYPVVGIYHGWGGSKVVPSSTSVQNWVKQGYAVFSITDRGWGSSCGSPSKPANTVKAAPCAAGYIHLMSRKYEVRDVQTLLGKLADEGLINPQQIGATGGSYGGGMALQLGSLKDRVELLNGEFIPWVSPLGKAMKIAATAPEYPWSDIATALSPNGSSKDYVTNDPYRGINNEYRYGIEKNNWNGTLYLAGQLLGYYGPESDPEANLTGWHNFNIKGGPYDGEPLAVQQEEFLPFHSPYYTPLNEAPAPSIMENGFNDDLFPADETVRYYNKVRAAYPNQPIKIFDLDLGHNPRSASTVSTADAAKLLTAQQKWFKYFIKGEGGEPSEAQGGVSVITGFCPQTAGGSGTEYDASNWASLAPGEIRTTEAAEKTIASPATAPANAFTSGTICTTSANGDNASAAEYRLPTAPTGGFTVAGSSTVIAEFSTPGANDQVIARLYDENPTAKTEQLIGRAMLRPLNPGGGFTQQSFQMHPNAWKVEAGHVVKLELLTADSTYARTSSSPHSVQVRNLELRVPTIDAPGSAEGLVQAPAAKYLPSGYTLALNQTTAAPTAPKLTSGSAVNSNGQFTLGWEATQAADKPTYTFEQANASGTWTVVASALSATEYAFTSGKPEGEGTWAYRVTESNASAPSAPSPASEPVKVDKTAPNAPTASADRAPEYAGGGSWFKDTVTVSFTANGDALLADGSAGSGVDASTLAAPQTFSTDGSHTASGTVADKVGNVSTAGPLTVQVDATAPTVEVKCPVAPPVGSTASATVVASDGQSGLATDPSGSVPVNTSEAGPTTTSVTAIDNVGHETTASCVTNVGFPTPGAPTLSAGTNPNGSGLFSLSWTGSDPMQYLGLSYTLQHHNAASEEWTTVATEIGSLSYEFSGPGETEGTWVYRVQGSDPAQEVTTEWSPASEAIKVDKSAPNAPTASADRAADYAGGGGWYKDTVTVSFTANGDPLLSDGSSGTGVDNSTLAAPQTFSTSGSHTASGTVADNVGNVSTAGTLSVQVDATAPTVEVKCPATTAVGSEASATVVASDAQSGLASDPSGSVPIDTSKTGSQTVTRSATDNVGHETTTSCKTNVVNTTVITGKVKGKLVVKAGEAVELTSTAQANGIEVQAGGALDVEGASTKAIKASKPSSLRICGAKVAAVTVTGATGQVVIGDSEGCAGSATGAIRLSGNTAGVSVVGNTTKGSVKITGNSGGATVTGNTVKGSLVVTGNTGTVVDSPNTVGGKSKLQ